MKPIIFLLIIICAFSAPAFSQKVGVENRDGKAVIVTRDTTEAGETKETVEWKSNPSNVLTKQLKEVDQYAAWLQMRIDIQTAELKNKLQEKSDLEAALKDLEKGIIIETGIPGETTPAPKSDPVKKSVPASPTKSKKTKKQ